MPRFAANLTMLFTEHPFLERFAAAAQSGFDQVEFLFPYEHPVDEVRAALREAGLEQVLFNLPAGDFAAGQRGIANDPARVAEFRDGVERALEIAARLGLEPFDPSFTGGHLRALARGSRAPVKAFLLDQKRIAGVGNIYADEALFRARIHPLRPVGSIARAQLDALRDAVVEALEAGIAAKGATIDDFRDPYGVQGSFQDQFLVHLREGRPCSRCATPVIKLRAAGRGTYVCPRCQKAPRPRRARRGP